MRELGLYLTSPRGTARQIIWFNGRPFWSNGEGFKPFFSGLGRFKCRCAFSDKSLSKKPAKHCRNPAKILFAGRSLRRWITPDILLILPLQQLRVRLGDLYNQRHRYDRYGFYISHFGLLEMSVIIQKSLSQVIFLLLLVLYLISQIMGLPSPWELYRRRAQDSEVKVVFLLKCWS